MNKTILQTIEEHAQQSPGLPAILAPGRSTLDYAGLAAFIEEVAFQFGGRGIGHNDAVAIVLPNGPEMATAFLSVLSSSIAAPLNPAYRAEEFQFYFPDLGVKALIVQNGVPSQAVETAERMGIPVIDLQVDENDPAGIFHFSTLHQNRENHVTHKRPAETALLLHTSGTTARPKIVPLSQVNLLHSAGSVIQSLHLKRSDRCLNIMPLFHIHGLVACLLATLAAGASVVCTPGFYVTDFLQWMEDFQPSWYSAVPGMHQAVLERISREGKSLNSPSLRVIRSCSAPLSPRLMQALEQTFYCPVVEAYGMTEASHQIACNALPPGIRKPGSVGVATGTQVAIMQEEGSQLLGRYAEGEIVIRGFNVTSGYLDNPQANKNSFTRGWFHTGDRGYIDDDGYIFLSGRIKELINRDGEKISPREIEEVLMQHPDIRQAVAFAMPDARLGEAVAAAVITGKPGVTEKSLQHFAAQKLAHFKVPQRILIVDQIPRGPTGKIQRTFLAKELGLLPLEPEEASNEVMFSEPQNELQALLAGLWCEVLKLDKIGIHHSFLDAGGDSVLAVRLISRINAEFDTHITMVDFFDAATIYDQSAIIMDQILTQIEGNTEGQAGQDAGGGS